MPGDKYAQVHLDAGTTPLGQPEPSARPRADLPFRILILADLRGSATVGRPPLTDRRPVPIDRDEYDAVLARFAPGVEVRPSGAGSAPVSLRFRDIDDFHPDSLYAEVPAFSAMRDLRQRLEDPGRFRDAALELTGEDGSPPARKPGATLLDDILGGEDGGAGEPLPPVRPARDDLQSFIRTVMRPHLVPGEDPRQAGLVERVDRGVTSLMRGMLHDPGFQAVESIWRALYLLVRQIETDSMLGIRVLDITREELESDLAEEKPIEETALYRVIVEAGAGTAGGEPWSLIAGDFTFGPEPGQVHLLSRMAEIGRATNAPFLAAADPGLVGCRSFGEEPDPAGWAAPDLTAWDRFRAGALARHVGLAAPRFLLRPPHGKESEPLDSFAFEEVEAPPAHDALLWGNPALAVTLLVAQAFGEAGWDMRPGANLDLSGLPLHLYRSEGSSTAQPCAEMLMTDRAASRLLDTGIIPMASIRDADRIRVVRIQSVASPPRALAGRWHTGS